MKKTIAALISTLLCALCACAQSDTTVWFVNIYPGHDIYELEGHSTIVVNIPDRMPVAYNFGVFDFNSPNFVYRFVKGETDYKAVAQPATYLLDYYIRQGRRIVAHRLDIDSTQTASLLQRLNENILPQNSVYRYNYVKDNCATRPLAAVQSVFADTITLAPNVLESESSRPVTFRSVMRHYHRNYPWYQFGIDIALGCGIDYPLQRSEMAFAPALLDTMLPASTAGGKRIVAESTVINDVSPDSAIASPTPWPLTPMCVCCCIFALSVCLTVRDIRRRRVTAWFDATLFGILGLLGLLLTFLIFVSEHEATSPNYLYLWLNPLCLVPAIFIWIKKASSFLVCYQIANFAVLTALCLSWPWVPQSGNPAFIPLIAAEMLRSASYIYLYRFIKQ